MPSRSRVVLLTGAAGGIGRVMMRALLRGGHCVAAVDRDAKSLERLKSLSDSTERLCPIDADLSRETGCAHAIEIARERFGTIEALVNNAGIGMSAIRPDAEVRHPGIEELLPEIWDRFFAIFVRAPVILTRLTLPLIREARPPTSPTHGQSRRQLLTAPCVVQSRDPTKVSRRKRHASGLLPQLASLAVPEAGAPLPADPRANLSVEHTCHPEIRVHHDAPAARPC
jgi:NAD(P)-dependent dehydrogenase (short-subunit alcohol dehydrogenase family)